MCVDCNNTGEIKTESIRLDRPFYDKERKEVMYPVLGLNDWKMTQCPCVGEEECECTFND